MQFIGKYQPVAETIEACFRNCQTVEEIQQLRNTLAYFEGRLEMATELKLLGYKFPHEKEIEENT